MLRPEEVPKFVARVTLVAGVGLAAAPQAATGPLGLEDQQNAIRMLGLADLVIAQGLWRGASPAPWMAGRCALSLAQGAYLDGVAPRSSRPGLLKAGAALLYGLAVADGATAIMLRRAGE